MKQKIVNFLVSMALVVFAMVAGAACYHQYIVQSQRTGRGKQIIIREQIKEPEAAGCRPERKR